MEKERVAWACYHAQHYSFGLVTPVRECHTLKPTLPYGMREQADILSRAIYNDFKGMARKLSLSRCKDTPFL